MREYNPLECVPDEDCTAEAVSQVRSLHRTPAVLLAPERVGERCNACVCSVDSTAGLHETPIDSIWLGEIEGLVIASDNLADSVTEEWKNYSFTVCLAPDLAVDAL